MTISIENMIKQHTERIISGEIDIPKGICPKCQKKPNALKLHECRKRTYRYIVGCFVKKRITLLPRWKCDICEATFTDHPDFALPYKRYVKENVVKISMNYIKEEKESYQSVVTNNNAQIGYEEKDGQYVNHFIYPSSPWRWIDWLGHLKEYMATIFKPGELFYVFPKKYRSQHRKKTLQNAYMLLDQSDQTLFSHVMQYSGP